MDRAEEFGVGKAILFFTRIENFYIEDVSDNNQFVMWYHFLYFWTSEKNTPYEKKISKIFLLGTGFNSVNEKFWLYINCVFNFLTFYDSRIGNSVYKGFPWIRLELEFRNREFNKVN